MGQNSSTTAARQAIGMKAFQYFDIVWYNSHRHKQGIEVEIFGCRTVAWNQ